MKTCKMAMAACGAVLAGVVYGCIAGFCPRGDAVICAGMMALCLAYCRASMIYRKRRRQRQEAEALYRDFGHMWERLPDTWRTLVLSSHTEFERTFGHQAKKKRKLYNGMIKCDLFMYGNV